MLSSQLCHFIKPILVYLRGLKIKGDKEDLNLPLKCKEDMDF